MKLGSSVFLFGLAGLVACAGDDTANDSASSSSEVVGNVMANTAKVEKDRLIFPKSSIKNDLRRRIARYEEAISDGKKKEDIENVILKSDRQADAADAKGALRQKLDNPYGFLRRALSIRDDGDETIIKTEQATLEDVAKELNNGEPIEVGGVPAKSEASGIRPLGLDFGSPIHFSVSPINVTDKEIFRDGATFIALEKAILTVDPTIDVRASFGWSGLSSAHAFVDATVSSELAIKVGVGGSFQGMKEKEIFSSGWVVGSIMGVPLTLTLAATVGCELGVDGNVSVGSGVTAELNGFHAGGRYEDGSGVKTEFTAPKFDHEFHPPTVTATATAGAKCYVRPHIALLFADMVGPFVEPQGYARVEAAAIPPPVKAALYVGATVKVGGEFTVFGQELGRLETKDFPIGSEQKLWSR